jgi:hypothetical protein
MKRKLFIISVLMLLFILDAAGQQYTARGYWMMEHDADYIMLSGRQSAGEILSDADKARLENFSVKLAEYFALMTDEEKSLYYKNRAGWSARPGSVYQETEQIYSGERSTYTKYVAASGVYGFLYGSAGIYILGLESEAAIGIPLITGGLSALMPLATVKDKVVTTNSLLLSLHGKGIGAFQGAMLGVALVGNGNSDEGWGKLVAGLSIASSITFGHVGFSMGKKGNWTPGKIKLYTHYGILIPLESLALTSAFGVEDARIYGITSLAGGAVGYLIAGNIAKRNNFTRGDIFSIQTFTALNTGLGLGIISDIKYPESASILIPAATAMAGTLLSQTWVKNARLTNQQGRNTILATTGGAAVGFGISRLVSGYDVSTLDYVMPYITGLITYSVVTESYRRRNNAMVFAKESPTGWHFNLMPQNIFLNNRIASSGRPLPGNRMSMLPAFSASIVF